MCFPHTYMENICKRNIMVAFCIIRHVSLYLSLVNKNRYFFKPCYLFVLLHDVEKKYFNYSWPILA